MTTAVGHARLTPRTETALLTRLCSRASYPRTGPGNDRAASRILAGQLAREEGFQRVRWYTPVSSAMYLDLYFEAVASYNEYPRGRDVAQWTTVQQAREQVGRNLDATSLLIPAELRWKYGDGTAYSFRKLCMMPEGLARQLGGATATNQQ